MLNHIRKETLQEDGIRQAYEHNPLMHDAVKMLRQNLIEMGMNPVIPYTSTRSGGDYNDICLYSIDHSNQVIIDLSYSNECRILSDAWVNYDLTLTPQTDNTILTEFKPWFGRPGSASGLIEEHQIEGTTLTGKADDATIKQLAKWCLVGPQTKLPDGTKAGLDSPKP